MGNNVIMKTGFLETMADVLGGKCPNCRQARIFKKKKRLLFDFPEMKETCSHCGYHFEREPGYFLGAMYASYGLAVLEAIATFLILRYTVPTLQTLPAVLIIVTVILLLSVRNYRLSRAIWLYIFPQ